MSRPLRSVIKEDQGATVAKYVLVMKATFNRAAEWKMVRLQMNPSHLKRVEVAHRIPGFSSCTEDPALTACP